MKKRKEEIEKTKGEEKDRRNEERMREYYHRARECRTGETFSNQELGVREYYQQPSHIRRQRKEHTLREVKIDLPYFYGKDNIEAYLD